MSRGLLCTFSFLSYYCSSRIKLLPPCPCPIASLSYYSVLQYIPVSKKYQQRHAAKIFQCVFVVLAKRHYFFTCSQIYSTALIQMFNKTLKKATLVNAMMISTVTHRLRSEWKSEFAFQNCLIVQALWIPYKDNFPDSRGRV